MVFFALRERQRIQQDIRLDARFRDVASLTALRMVAMIEMRGGAVW